MLKASSLLLLALLAAFPAFAAEPFAGEKKDHHGAALYAVQIGGETASVLVPEKPLDGKPWVLAPSLYDFASPPVANMAKTEVELVKRGFHVVAFGLGNTFGAPDAVSKWDAVYAEMTSKYGLGAKPVLMGLSREGLAAMRWAANHLDQTSCIYLDKAVCDFKSWPGGKLGIGKGSAKDWESLKDLYHFGSEEAALTYKENPVDLAPKLAAARIPILYIAGETDDIVPLAENGARVQKEYEKLGVPFRLIVRKGEGHHPHGLVDSTVIGEFMDLNTGAFPLPTATDVSYGPHYKQVLHFWKAQSDKPTPVAFHIHGGGWMVGDRVKGQAGLYKQFLAAGISVVAITYRFIPEATADGENPPVHGPLSDSARALQYVRSKATEWGIDKK